MVISSNYNVEINRWYNLQDNLGNPFSGPDELMDIFSSSIGFRLRSDVPVGVCLSGGLDSSSIVSILLSKYNKKELKTFSAIYGNSFKEDESDYIKEFDDKLDNMHFVMPSAETLYVDMVPFIRAHSEPIPSTSPYAQYKVMELAKDQVVVTLDGQGADEQLAGYHYFFGYYYKELLRQLKWIKLFYEMTNYVYRHQSIFGLKAFIYFLIPKKSKVSARVRQRGYINEQFIDEYSLKNTISDNLYGSMTLREALLDHFEFKLEHLLKWSDRNSMWFSLESRVPFLDHRFVEKTLSLSNDDYIYRGMTKNILRTAMKGILPDKIRERNDKIGFATPADEWFRTEKFNSYMSDLFNSKLMRQRGYINIDTAIKLYENHCNRKVNISKEIWKWINLELWFQHFIDKD